MVAGIAGLFMEAHPDPDNAPSDGPNRWPFNKSEELLLCLKELDVVVQRQGLIEETLGL